MVNEEFDQSWIEKFEQEEKYYNMFYPEEIQKIKITFFYIDSNNALEKIKETKFNLQKSNIISKDEIAKLIKENEIVDEKKYNHDSIFVFNFSLNNEELKTFLKSKNEYNFTKTISSMDNFKLQSTINYLHEVNNLYFVFKEQIKKTSGHTKKIKFNLLKRRTRRKR
tara:strand:+ start:625 stop:1125 length:501 start_codon:yes stop_codon:yes gene_type:complete